MFEIWSLTAIINKHIPRPLLVDKYCLPFEPPSPSTRSITTRSQDKIPIAKIRNVTKYPKDGASENGRRTII